MLNDLFGRLNRKVSLTCTVDILLACVIGLILKLNLVFSLTANVDYVALDILLGYLHTFVKECRLHLLTF